MKEQPLPESADGRLVRVEQDVCEQRRMSKELVAAQREASAPLLRQWLLAWRAQTLHLGGGGKRMRGRRRKNAWREDDTWHSPQNAWQQEVSRSRPLF